jgi:hypothetical protein
VPGEKGEPWDASQDEPLPAPCWMQRAIVGGAERAGHRDHCGEAGRGFSAALGACVSHPSAASFVGTSKTPEIADGKLSWNLTGGAGTSLGAGGWRLWSGAEPACHGRRGSNLARAGICSSKGGRVICLRRRGRRKGLVEGVGGRRRESCQSNCFDRHGHVMSLVRCAMVCFSLCGCNLLCIAVCTN